MRYTGKFNMLHKLPQALQERLKRGSALAAGIIKSMKEKGRAKQV
jgi:hypothetical protein